MGFKCLHAMERQNAEGKEVRGFLVVKHCLTLSVGLFAMKPSLLPNEMIFIELIRHAKLILIKCQ